VKGRVGTVVVAQR